MKNLKRLLKLSIYSFLLSLSISSFGQAGFTVKAKEAGGSVEYGCFASLVEYTIDLNLYKSTYRHYINPTNPYGCESMKMLAYIDDLNTGFILAQGDIPNLQYSGFKDCPTGERVYRYSGTFTFTVDLNQYAIDPLCLDGSGELHDVILQLVERDGSGTYYPYDFAQCYNTCYTANYDPHVKTKFFCCAVPQSLVVNDNNSDLNYIKQESTAFYNGEEVQFLIQSDLDLESNVQIFNLNGQSLFDTEIFLNKGKNQFSVPAINLPRNGIYFARVLVNGEIETFKFYKH